jgi:2-dehydropantoate 2-reductase
MLFGTKVGDLRVAVVGLGALGGYYGGLLARNGADVHFLARTNFDAVRKNGLVVDTTHGRFELPKVNVYRRAEDMPKCDVVLVTIKATDNDCLATVLPHVLAEGGTTVLIQNGIGQEERLPAVAMRGAVYAGLGFICAGKSEQNHVVHSDYGALRLAVFQETDSSRSRHDGVEGLARFMSGAGIEIEREQDFLSARWKKLVWNIPFNGLSVVLQADTSTLVREASSRTLVETLMLEVVSAGRAEGCAILDDYVGQMIDATLRMKPYFPSMYHDFEAGRPLELEAMYFCPVERASQAGSAMPSVRMLAQELSFMLARRPAPSS